MKKKNDKQHKESNLNPDTLLSEVKNLKEIAERKEVNGRHKNDGHIGYKGAR